MRKSKEILPITFEKGVDQDTTLRRMEPGTYRNAVNIEPVPGSGGGERRVAWGHEEIDYTFDLGAIGQARAIGAVENKEGDFGVAFIRASTDYIYWTDGSEARLLASGDALGFEGTFASERVHSAAIVEGRYLYWVYSAYWNSENAGKFKLSGTSPKKLDIQRHMPKQRIEYELILNAQGYSSGSEYSYRITDRLGNVISGPTVFFTIPAPGDRDDIMLALFNAVNTIPGAIPFFYERNNALSPAPRLRFQYQGASEGDRIEIFASGTNGEDILQVELDYYPVDLTEEHLSLIKPCPLFEPTVSYEEDTTSDNRINPGDSYQFRYRYIFDDDEKSAWGPASRIPTNFRNAVGSETFYENDPKFNKIRVDLNDDKLNDAAWRVYIRKIELAYKTGKDGIWRSIDTYDLYQFDYQDITVDFYGIASNTAVPSDEDASEGAQALKNFDDVPKVASSLEYVYDENGNGIMLLGGGIYGYDVFDPDAVISLNTQALDTNITGASQTHKAKSLKRGGKYKVGVVFKDWAGRQTPAYFLREITVPWSLGLDGSYTEEIRYELDASLLSPVPSEMSAYQFVITENLNQAVWWRSQRMSVNPKFYKLNLDDNTLIDVGDDRADADYIGFIAYYSGDLDGATIFSGFRNDQGFVTPEPGDRVQIMSWNDNLANPPGTISPSHADRDEYNYQIAGYEFGSDSIGPYVNVLIDLSEDVPDWYWVIWVSIEVYRPKQNVNDQIYYEFGPVGGITSAIADSVDLSGYGDVYLSKAESKDFSGTANAPDPVLLEYTDTQFLNIRKDPDLGRAVVYDPDYQEQFDGSIIRASDIFIPNSRVNGLSSYRSTNFIYVNAALGPITKMVLNQNVLLAITASKAQPIYVAKDRLMSLSGTQVGRTSKLLNLASELRYDFGTTHPSSVVYEQGRTYGFDRRKGVVWRYSSGNGLQPITKGLFNYFRNTAFLNESSIRREYPAGFDRNTNLYYLNMSDQAAMFSDNYGWVGFSSNTPQAYLALNIRLLSVNRDRLFILSKDAPRANYLGFQSSALIIVAGVVAPTVSLFDAIEIEADGKWFARDVSTPKNPSYPDGQASSIPANRFTYYEGRGKAAFLRDQNDPDPRLTGDVQRLLTGRPLRNDAIEIRLEPVDPSLDNVIRIAYIYHQLSRQTTNT